MGLYFVFIIPVCYPILNQKDYNFEQIPIMTVALPAADLRRIMARRANLPLSSGILLLQLTILSKLPFNLIPRETQIRLNNKEWARANGK